LEGESHANGLELLTKAGGGGKVGRSLKQKVRSADALTSPNDHEGRVTVAERISNEAVGAVCGKFEKPHQPKDKTRGNEPELRVVGTE